jgi:hypothetical protein
MAEENDTQNFTSFIKVDRTRKLIADFENGYAKGWFFAVKECFKDELDIKYTQRVEAVKVDGAIQYEEVLDKNGNVKTKKKTKKTMEWTQGPYYSFNEGHVIYDTPKAYLIWSEALKYLKVRCEVLRSQPNRFHDKYKNWSKVTCGQNGFWEAKEKTQPVCADKKKGASKKIPLGNSLEKYMNGQVIFKLSKPNKDKTCLETIGQYYLSQLEFIEFLKTGTSPNVDVRELIDSSIDVDNLKQNIEPKQTAFPF